MKVLQLEVRNLGDFSGPYTSLLMIKRPLCVLGIRREVSHTASPVGQIQSEERLQQ